MRIGIVLNAPYKIKKVKEENVIYTDGGYVNSKYLKSKTTLAVIGDFDTLSEIPENENVIKLDKEKNFTDGERAIYYAKETGATQITIYGGTEGRIEHVLGNFALLSLCKKLGLNAVIVGESNKVYLENSKCEITQKKGYTVSVIPYTDSCTVESSFGLKYPLNNLTLTKSDTRGISNVATDNKFGLNIISGEALIILNENK